MTPRPSGGVGGGVGGGDWGGYGDYHQHWHD